MAVTVNKQRFSLSLGGDWEETASSDPEITRFSSRQHAANLVISTLALNAKLADTGRIAEKLSELRMDSETQVAAETGIDVTIARPKIVQQPWGHAIAYYGADANGRRFNFSGLVTPKQSISVYAESSKLGEEVLRELLEQVLAKLKFDLA
ncbi:MAG: hypothetical protein HY054_10760 [Proteobacteria bacterium]|nr:hypothetical protein [Pseudomonadota bacterium]